jgi:hypothetical protein
MAQTPTGSIVGRVTDRTAAAVPGSVVKVRNEGTNLIRTVTSQADGEYTVADLAPGTYDVTVAKEGFRTGTKTGIEVQVDQTVRLDVRLEVGTLSESVEIKTEVAIVNTETFTKGETITPREVQEMPLNGRNFNDLAFLVPGVQPAEQSAKGSAYVTNGVRADGSGFLIEGLNNENPRDAGAQAQPPLDSLMEFKFETSGYSAQYGRLAGGVINMALKTGANDLHGALFEYIRNDLFDARNFFDGANKSELRRNQFGGTLSGPVILPKLYNGHDRTFFLVSWESFRGVAGNNNIGVVPTAMERSGNFSQDFNATGQLVLIKDPLSSGACSAATSTSPAKTAGCFPNNIIPASRIDPIATAVLKNYPAPNYANGGNNFLANYSSPDSWNSFVFKVDQKVRSADNLSVRVLTRWENSGNPFAGSPLGTFGAQTKSFQSLYGIAETHVFTPTLINEFHGGLTRTVSNETANDAGTNWAAQLGIPGTTSDPSLAGYPKFTITGYETVGDNASDPIRYVVSDWNYNDALTWIKGKHVIKGGVDWLRVQYYQPTNTNFNGSFSLSGKATNDGVADLLLSNVASATRTIGTVTNHIYESNLGAYVLDDYKILPSLTLNLGLRYEIAGQPYEKYGQLTNFVPGLNQVAIGGVSTLPNWQAIEAAAGLAPYVTLASSVGLPIGTVKTNYDNFAPRVGFAWRPFGNNRTVIRSGYGVFYTGSRLSAMRTDLTGGFPFGIAQTITGSTSGPPTVTLGNPFPPSLVKNSGTTTVSGYQVNAPSPYVQSWNFTLEREIAWGVAVEAGYTGSKGTHLGRKYDINQQVVTATATTRPYPEFGDIEYYTFGQNSSYNAGTVTVRKRYQNGLTFRASYTRAKSIDTNSGLNYAGAGGYQGAQNSLNLLGERGLSDFDIRNSFVMSFVYQAPFRRNVFIRGWQLAGNGTAYSGQPFTPTISGNKQDLGQYTRPNRIASGSLPNPTASDWFNLNAFVAPASLNVFGNSGRNILEGPGTVGLNLALSRTFTIGERNRIQFRWEAFNAINHTNFQLPADALDKANAGSITGNKAARQQQLALTYRF